MMRFADAEYDLWSSTCAYQTPEQIAPQNTTVTTLQCDHEPTTRRSDTLQATMRHDENGDEQTTTRQQATGREDRRQDDVGEDDVQLWERYDYTPVMTTVTSDIVKGALAKCKPGKTCALGHLVAELWQSLVVTDTRWAAALVCAFSDTPAIRSGRPRDMHLHTGGTSSEFG